MKSLRIQLTEELEKIPGLEKCVLQREEADFIYFTYKGKETAHFDNDNELDLRLGKAVIKQEGLTHPADSRNHPHRGKSKPHWIVLQFTRVDKIQEVVRLVKLAINQG